MQMRRLFILFLGLVVLTVSPMAVAFAQEPSDIRVDTAVRALEMGPLEVRADLTVDLFNTVGERRIANFELKEVPDGWDIGVWDRFYDFTIRQIVVEPPPEELAVASQSLRLRIDLPKERPQAGDYSFELLVTSPDGRVEYDEAFFTITVPEPPPSSNTGVDLSATFPVLRGPSTSAFEFEIVIDNDTGADSSFSLEGEALDATANALTGWEVTYTPTFGEERLISSISVGAALSERVDVRVTPPRNTDPGDYFVPVKVSDDAGFEATTLLQVTIRGRGEIIVSTDTGLLNVDATAGEAASTKLRITNIGTAPLEGISLVADAPQGWEVTFDPAAVPPLPAANLIDIPVRVVPAGDAIPGDYLITLRANHPETADILELRVTVAQSTIWGWLGIVLVLAVVGGLGGLFWRLGRR